MKRKGRITRMFQRAVLVLAATQAVQGCIWLWPGLKVLGQMIYPLLAVAEKAISTWLGLAPGASPCGVVVILVLYAIALAFAVAALGLIFWLVSQWLFVNTREEKK